jgi:hypothetical protein
MRVGTAILLVVGCLFLAVGILGYSVSENGNLRAQLEQAQQENEALQMQVFVWRKKATELEGALQVEWAVTSELRSENRALNEERARLIEAHRACSEDAQELMERQLWTGQSVDQETSSGSVANLTELQLVLGILGPLMLLFFSVLAPAAFVYLRGKIPHGSRAPLRNSSRHSARESVAEHRTRTSDIWVRISRDDLPQHIRRLRSQRTR